MALGLVALALLWLNRPSGGTLKGFATDPGEEIGRVDFSRQGAGGETENVHLVHQREGGWIVNGQHRADPRLMRQLLLALQGQEVIAPLTAAEAARLQGIMEQEGVRVDVFLVSRLTHLPFIQGPVSRKRARLSFLVGPDAGGKEGTAMRHTGQEPAYWVHLPGLGDGLRSLYDREGPSWRDPLVFDMPRKAMALVEAGWAGQPTSSFGIRFQEDGSARLYDPEGNMVPDTLIHWVRLNRFLNALGEVRYDRLLLGDEKAPVGQLIETEPFLRLSVTDQEGVQQSVSCFRIPTGGNGRASAGSRADTDPDRFLLLMKDGRVAMAFYHDFGRLLQPFGHFLADAGG